MIDGWRLIAVALKIPCNNLNQKTKDIDVRLIKCFFIVLLVFSKSSLALMLTGNDSLVFSGNEGFIDALDSFSLTVQETSRIAFLTTRDNSSVNVLGGEISWIIAHNNAKIDISGGDISWLEVYDDTVTNIESLFDLSWLLVSNNSVVNIYGSNFRYLNGHLSGSWSDGNPFSFWAMEESKLSVGDIGDILPENIVLHDVPEPLPISIMVIGLAGIIYRRKFINSVIGL